MSKRPEGGGLLPAYMKNRRTPGKEMQKNCCECGGMAPGSVPPAWVRFPYILSKYGGITYARIQRIRKSISHAQAQALEKGKRVHTGEDGRKAADVKPLICGTGAG